MKLDFTIKSLKFRALGMVTGMLVLVVTLLTVALTYGFTSSYTDAFLDKAFVVGQEFRNNLSKALNLGLTLDSLEGVSDECMVLTQKHENIGYCIITDTAGKVLYADDPGQVGKVMDDAVSAEAAKEVEEGRYRTFTYKDKKYYDAVIPLKDAEDKHIGALRLGLGYEELGAKKDQLVKRSVLIGVVSLVIAIFAFTFFITRFITDPISYLVVTATQIAKGDLTKTIDVKTEDELGALAGAINTMVANLKNMLGKVKDASISVTNATERIAINSKKISEGALVQQELTESTSSSMEEMNASIREVAESVESLSSSAESSSSSIMEMAASIDEVASITNDLSASTESTSSSIMEMAATVRQVSENVDVLSSAAEETTASATEMGASIKEVESVAKESTGLSEKVTAEASELGMRAVEKTIKGMEEIKDTVVKAAHVIEQLGGRSEEIGEILNVIDEVTDQTSLLALNAAILAAQAGEHGKGFAVVASEIKDLAERTSSSTSEIAKLIGAVQTEARDAVVSIKSGRDSVEQGVKIAYEAKDALVKIVESSSKSASMSKGIEKATVEQAEGIRQVSDAMLSISDMVQHILKATQEQAKGTEQIMMASEKMSEIAKQVRNAMAEQAKGSKQITMAVENVSEKVQHIASATSEQRKGSQEIVGAIEKIRDITAQSVTLASEMDQSVTELTRQADVLREEINHFVLMSEYNLADKTLRMGVIPIEDASAMRRHFTPLAEYLSDRLGVKVEVVAGHDMSETVNDLGQGRTDICYMSPTTYVEARHKFGAKVLVTASAKGRPSTNSVIATREGSGVNSLADVAGRTFAFGDEKSSTSHLMPRAVLAEAGIKLQDLKSYKYMHRQDEVVRAVLEGDADAGGMAVSIARQHQEEGLRVVHVSGDIPNFNVVAGKNLDKATREQLREALAAMKVTDPAAAKALRAIDPEYDGFVKSSDSDYEGVRKMMKQIYGIEYK
ncbi:MAG: phosphate/phosphite/phosphonate ABC transporter substrate-binding protein [Nitrospirae bacterium]|nr:phosphate/phosphite/phosphonate ABC transporter substrate-binding protein [Nitrospirota bacterium]